MTYRFSLRRQSGFGLIEVLVTILILSIAFLGLAVLVVRALATNNTSMARSVATIAAYSIQDAMRADRNSAINGDYNGKVTAGDNCHTATGTLKDRQLSQWCAALANPVLNGAASATGTISCQSQSAAGGCICSITITWDDSRNGVAGGSTTQTVTTVGTL